MTDCLSVAEWEEDAEAEVDFVDFSESSALTASGAIASAAMARACEKRNPDFFVVVIVIDFELLSFRSLKGRSLIWTINGGKP